MKSAGDMILVSNRLPITTEMGPHGPVLKPSSGGLVTALRPVLKTRKGYWIGWPGDGPEDQVQRLLEKEHSESQVQLVPVSLTASERKGFYAGFSNEIVWPLFHDLQSRCNFDPTYWKAYVHVNRKFADAVVRVSHRDSLVWVHDYHLMLVATFCANAAFIPGSASFSTFRSPRSTFLRNSPGAVRSCAPCLPTTRSVFRPCGISGISSAACDTSCPTSKCIVRMSRCG